MTINIVSSGIAACFTAISLSISTPAAAEVVVDSPDGDIRVSVSLNHAGQARYEVAFRDKPVIMRSRLGLRFRDHVALEDALRIATTSTASADSTWEQPWGERRLIRDRYNALTVEFESTDGPSRKYWLEVRAHDDGIGFRYVVPEQPYLRDVAIVDELTEFRLERTATAWWIPGRAWNRYEYLYRKTPVTDMALAHTPATFRLTGGTHVSIHEAALVDFPAFVLEQRRPGVLRTNLTPLSSGLRALKQTPFTTPWRTIQISSDAVGLLNSDLILNLNEPNALGDVSWVEPGKYVGIWWAMHLDVRSWESGEKHGATTAETKRYIDFAAANGIDGVLVEGWNVGWDGNWLENGAVFSFTDPYPDFDLRAVAAYAEKKGVRLVGHHETSGHITNYESQMDAALDLYESLGVRQVKTGYVAEGGELEWVDEDGVTHYEWHDSQFGVNHFQRSLVAAAERRISINMHEPIKDTGLRRTWPNWISREGARGQEYNAWGTPPNSPGHTTVLPYTRMLSGPMDFTPGIFDLTFEGKDSSQRVPTTLAKQLALYVVIYSPNQMVADLPENYARFPDAFEFIRAVPTDWERSVALSGEIGDYVVQARRDRNSDTWYLGALTNEHARTVSLPLRFLSPGTRYSARVYRDGENAHWRDNPYAYSIETVIVDAAQSLDIAMAPGGGSAVQLRPIPSP